MSITQSVDQCVLIGLVDFCNILRKCAKTSKNKLGPTGTSGATYIKSLWY